ncbi:MAG: hypothetical protein JWM01_803 [Arthrobacter sp.]|nr:hypothetical protein [Arthrobacter sp.]
MLIQARAAGGLDGGLATLRAQVASSVGPERYYPAQLLAGTDISRAYARVKPKPGEDRGRGLQRGGDTSTDTVYLPVMGVSGSGKFTVAQALVVELGRLMALRTRSGCGSKARFLL